MQDESIFIHDSIATKTRKWIVRDKRPIVTITGSRDKTIVYGALSFWTVNSYSDKRKKDLTANQTFIDYLEEVKKKFRKFVI